jgi:putative hydrolase of the HAD superfamily
LKKLDLTHEEVWYVGNKFEFDVIGAFNALMYPVWINVNQEEAHLDIEHLDVQSYDQLIKVLKDRWNNI